MPLFLVHSTGYPWNRLLNKRGDVWSSRFLFGTSQINAEKILCGKRHVHSSNMSKIFELAVPMLIGRQTVIMQWIKFAQWQSLPSTAYCWLLVAPELVSKMACNVNGSLLIAVVTLKYPLFWCPDMSEPKKVRTRYRERLHKKSQCWISR
jgi:thiazole synthase ThiGH ThiG subunit